MKFNWNSPDVAIHLKLRDPDCCEQLYLDWHRFIRCTGRSCGLPPDLLDDLVQEVLLSLIGPKGGGFDPSKGSFYTFLKHVVKLRSIDLLRRLYTRMNTKEKIFAQLRLEDEAFLPDWVSRPPDREKQLKELLRQLQRNSSSLHYQIFCRVMLKGEKPGDAAAASGIPLPTLYSIVSRMTVRLKKLAAERQQEPPESMPDDWL